MAVPCQMPLEIVPEETAKPLIVPAAATLPALLTLNLLVVLLRKSAKLPLKVPVALAKSSRIPVPVKVEVVCLRLRKLFAATPVSVTLMAEFVAEVESGDAGAKETPPPPLPQAEAAAVTLPEASVCTHRVPTPLRPVTVKLPAAVTFPPLVTLNLDVLPI